MKEQNEHHSFTGMQRDIAISKNPSGFLYDARNIRITQREDDTLIAITNERGTVDLNKFISGKYLGHCLLNNWLVVFSKMDIVPQGTSPDYITRFDLSEQDNDEYPKVVLYAGNLNFSADHLIEAIGSYENESVQKVYWTDGYNQPRIINVTPEYDPSETYDESNPVYASAHNTAFDFVRELQLNETVKVRKVLGAGGMFPAGVIQYAFTYYDKYGQESNIFYTSPLLYTSHKDRGGSPEDKVDNGFEVTIENPDTNFDYVRIYSIMRTSVNGTPIARRVEDIYLHSEDNVTSVSYLDVGTSGETIDPTELLYKGGEEITAQTIEQKDGTLFLGNINITRPSLNDIETSIDFSGITISCNRRIMYLQEPATGTYAYTNQLTSFADSAKTESTSCSGFKRGDYYRLGMQFQYKTGKWSEPVFIGDYMQTSMPFHGTAVSDNSSVILPTFVGNIPSSVCSTLLANDYIKARPVVVFPNLQDRVTLCQGVTNPTVYQPSRRYQDPSSSSEEDKGIGDLWAQSSWFFRPYLKGNGEYIDGTTVSPIAYGALEYTSNAVNGSSPSGNPENIRKVEIQGQYDTYNKFNVDRGFCTFHSPDVEFDDSLWLYDFTSTNVKYRRIGRASFSVTMSNIDIQTKSATISSDGGGFKKMASTHSDSYGWVSGLFWDDYLVDDTKKESNPFGALSTQWSSCKWVVYPWHRTGSLNNDINRPADKGTRSSELEKKVISNLRYADTIFDDSIVESSCSIFGTSDYPKIFNSDQLSILKFGNHIYQGNIDTLLMPDDSDGMYFAFGTVDTRPINALKINSIPTPFSSTKWWKTWCYIENGDTKKKKPYYWDTIASSPHQWQPGADITIGDEYPELGSSREPVRMKYKTTPHITAAMNEGYFTNWPNGFHLPIFEIVRYGDNSKQNEPLYRSTMFGGTSKDALQANNWVPCGEPVRLDALINIAGEGETPNMVVPVKYSYGDTYYQRWDCLKTYPFTKEDINQIVEIGSFMLETHVNIDGRYDRNRGQSDNTNMSPINFNLMNPVYSQTDNFFTYKILDESFYKNNSFPNQVTWTKEKQAGADVDLWTNITLASTYDMDGSKGEVISLNTWKDSIFCFQNKGISNILFNSRVQIPTSDGVPIEISNSYKVDGYRYITDGTGCVNKWSIRETPAGIYFIDSVTNDLYHVGEGLTDVSLTHNMQTWFKDNTIDRTLYDDVHHDIYLVNDTEALCYSEILGQFTSFMDYGGMYLLESCSKEVFSMKKVNNVTTLFKMFKGGYNDLFGYYTHAEPQQYRLNYRPWHISFISNGLDNKDMDFDKIFTNIDYRMDLFDSTGAYLPEESFDTIRVFNEYQDTGDVTLKHPVVIGEPTSYNLDEMNLEKKYRIWRIQIPRDSTNILDRIRNPWCKITLSRNAQDNNKAVLQDLNVQYFV